MKRGWLVVLIVALVLLLLGGGVFALWFFLGRQAPQPVVQESSIASNSILTTNTTSNLTTNATNNQTVTSTQPSDRSINAYITGYDQTTNQLSFDEITVTNQRTYSNPEVKVESLPVAAKLFTLAVATKLDDSGFYDSGYGTYTKVVTLAEFAKYLALPSRDATTPYQVRITNGQVSAIVELVAYTKTSQ